MTDILEVFQAYYKFGDQVTKIAGAAKAPKPEDIIVYMDNEYFHHCLEQINKIGGVSESELRFYRYHEVLGSQVILTQHSRRNNPNLSYSTTPNYSFQLRDPLHWMQKAQRYTLRSPILRGR